MKKLILLILVLVFSVNIYGQIRHFQYYDEKGILVWKGDYSLKYHCPLWISYFIYKGNLKKNTTRYSGGFRIDEGLGLKNTKFDKGYDRGHICPSASKLYSWKANYQTFWMSNIAPQRAKFNRGPWKDLEDEIRNLAESLGGDTLYITKGCIFGKNYMSNGICIPDTFWIKLKYKGCVKQYRVPHAYQGKACLRMFRVEKEK